MRVSFAFALLALAGCTMEHRRDEDDAFVSIDTGPLADTFVAVPDATSDAGLDANADAPCPSGFVSCGGSCVRPAEDPTFCGASAACMGYDTCVGNEVCIFGRCELACDPGLTNCLGFCVNTQFDPTHCGASYDTCSGGVACAPGEYCAFGGCASDCPPGLIQCFGRCLDPLSDRQYCGVRSDCTGGAGTCVAGEACSGGRCVDTCPKGQLACGGRCVDPLSDAVYCGAASDCGGGETCAFGQVCVGGTCAASCPAPEIACGARCVDPESDEGYCGADTSCMGGAICESGAVCREGRCVADCAAGSIECGGRCVDPRTDATHCGASSDCTGGVVCGAREGCVDGVCGCVAPERDCGSGCVDVRFDPTSCGGCGVACDRGEVCAGGACMPRSGPGLTGGFGTTWTSYAFREVDCIQEFVPRPGDLFVGRGSSFGAWDIGAETYRAAADSPVAHTAGCSLAYFGGGIFRVTARDVLFYEPPTDTWRTAPLGMDLGAVGMTITDLDSLWSATRDFLVRGSPATSAVGTIAVDGPLTLPRITFDDLTDRLYYASQGSNELRSYDARRDRHRLEGTAPGPIGAAFCSDRAGHLYVGSQTSPAQIWQYTPASGTWRALPVLPGAVTGTTNCGVAEVGALYVAASPGTTLFRLPLDWI
ncbi:MAG: hypothetical protein J0L92_29870 [Deltaproteobacteria bacterium]|nr:hypothetical protein [Deltaproteobacteria bacterium]